MNKTLLFVLLTLSGCGNEIETGNTLDKRDKDYIRSLKLLDKDEEIIKFYSEFRNKTAGNFFTNKRIAKYWIDERDKSKSTIDFAYYHEIRSIDTVYNRNLNFLY